MKRTPPEEGNVKEKENEDREPVYRDTRIIPKIIIKEIITLTSEKTEVRFNDFLVK